jgi:hypothetical protein
VADPAAARATDLLARAELNRLTANGTRVDADVSTEGLGVVRVAATSTSNGLELNLQSDQAAARSLLMGHAEELRQQLRRDGLDVSTISVDPRSTDGATDDGQSAAFGHRTGHGQNDAADHGAGAAPPSPTGGSHPGQADDRHVDDARDPGTNPRSDRRIDLHVDEHIDLVM